MASITADQALELLRSNPLDYVTLDQLKGLVARGDIFAEGSVTVVYGGASNSTAGRQNALRKSRIPLIR